MIEIHVKTSALHLENLSDQLLLLGAHAITWQDAANQPIYEPAPGEIIPWQSATIVALFDNPNNITSISNYLNLQQQEDILKEYTFVTPPNKDWVRASLDQFQPINFGKHLWIVPSWLTPPNEEAVNVFIDPGLAFGTGTHPTTALCLTWLDENINEGVSLVDYGCGSGILAVAAIKLGARAVIAIDYDEQALIACKANAELNSVTDKLITHQAAPADLTKSDIVIANILAKTIIEHKATLIQLLKPRGKLVLSGILTTQSDDVIAAFSPLFTLLTMTQQDEWVCISFEYQA
jgi:ribosomal protein L11 methyltransferase